MEMAHSGHPGMAGAKRLLRKRLWFPQMDRMVEQVTEECTGCQASTKVTRRDPLMPREAQEEP